MTSPPQSDTKLRLVINGEWHEVPAGLTVADLLRQFGLADKPVAVERNLEVVPRSRYEQTELAAGDRIEIVTLVGGG